MSIKNLLARPLIVGASISADYGTPSPAKRLALRYTELENIVTVARPGTPGFLLQPGLTDLTLADRTIVIAMDMFFWDSTLPALRASQENILTLAERVAAKGIPLILGTIPELLPGRQPQRSPLNRYLEDLSHSGTDCRLWDLDALHRRVMRDRHLDIDGRRYLISHLIPDGLHLAAFAAEYLADELAKVIDPRGRQTSLAPESLLASSL